MPNGAGVENYSKLTNKINMILSMKSTIATIAILALVGLGVGMNVGAADVVATVTPLIISLSVTSGSVNYGVLDVDETNNTFNGAATTDTQTIENTGTVSIDVLIKSSDAVGSTINWDLEATKGADQYVHSYDINASVPAFTVFPVDNTNTSSVVTLANNGNTATMDLKIDMPSSISDVTVHTITVTVVATAS